MQTQMKNSALVLSDLLNAVVLIGVVWDNETERWPRTTGVLF